VTACIFCQIVEGTLPSSKVYEDEICLAFMDIQPVNPGHLLVVPKRHFVDLSDLPGNIGAHLFHVHLHVIPRYKGDSFGFRFGPNYSNLPERFELDAIASHISNQIKVE